MLLTQRKPQVQLKLRRADVQKGSNSLQTSLHAELLVNPASNGSADVPLPRIAPLKPTPVYDTYWRFAAERQEIFFRRIEGQLPPWTSDTILRAYKFTNAYRASDRVSQFLIRHVIYRNDLPDTREEVFFRILLYKMFNRIETWELLENTLGTITWEEYDFQRYDQILSDALARDERIYSAAYIMPSAGSLGHNRKHRNHLTLIEHMMADELPKHLSDTPSMQEAFEMLRSYPSLGDFLAYQFVTDLNYSPLMHFSEMAFVVPGPGALDGIRKCFADRGGLNDAEIIRFMADRQETEFERLGLRFHSLWGRRLQLIDCQNLFCEVGKYARVRHPEIDGISGRARIKQRFQANSTPITYWYPPKWGINDLVVARPPSVSTSLRSHNMDLETYQTRASQTDRTPATDEKGMMIPLLGLAGEAGELLTEYKKFLRDGESHVLFKERFAEELGDLLWYLTNVATKFGLSLTEIAQNNLIKCEQRWLKSQTELPPFDEAYSDSERLPRQFQIDFNTIHDVDGKPQMKAYYKGKQFGNDLTDNAYEHDGYRFHDVFHLAFAAVLGWSPITRSLLERKRRSIAKVDEVEDGGRAKAIEEGISALIFAYAKDYNWLEGKASVSSELLRTIKSMTAQFEVSRCSTGEWENAILQGFAVWRKIKRQGGGTLVIDLDQRSISIKRG
jgi:NTP pyrophosphatase (non-canonical NTP hydrolase)